MKTIKDILKTDNYEQRRRIANNLTISRDDKNALIANQCGGGDSDPLFTNTRYYRVDWSKQVSVIGSAATTVLGLSADFIIFKFNSQYIGTKLVGTVMGDIFADKLELYIRVSDYKLMAGANSNYEVIYTDNFYDNQETIALMNGINAYYSKEDLDAMLIPITEEEFLSKLNN